MIVATAGHVDHGKTALVRAMTGIDTDRLPEEKARGLTIDLGFAYKDLGEGATLGFVDVPGHERFIRNMLAGVAGVEMALLVVAADDGVMPQTREHLAILDLLGIEQGFVALTKIDRVDAARIEVVSSDITALLADTKFAHAPVFPVSAVTGEGVATLRQTLEHLSATAAEEEARGQFRLAIDRAFTVPGAGQVVTGTVFAGEVRIGDELVLSARARPEPVAVRLRGLNVQNRPAERGRRGDRCALNIAGAELSRAEIHRGDWVLAGGLHTPTGRFDAELRVPGNGDRALRHWTPVHVHHAASHVTGRVAVLEGREIAPGETGLVRLVLDAHLCALHGDRFILRDQSAQETLAGGRVIDPFPPARGRARPERLEVLSAFRERDPSRRLERLLAFTPAGLDLASCRTAWNLSNYEAEALFSAAGIVRIEGPEGAFALDAPHWIALKAGLLDAMERFHGRNPRALGADELALRRMLSFRPVPAMARAALRNLEKDGSIARRGTLYHLPGHEVTPTAEERRWWQRVGPVMTEAGRHPPPLRDLAAMLDCETKPLEAFLGRAVELGWLVQVAKSFYFRPGPLGELAAIAEALGKEAPDERFTVGDYRDRTGIGRNLSVRILEYFDRIGFTRREGDRRRVLRPAAEAVSTSSD